MDINNISAIQEKKLFYVLHNRYAIKIGDVLARIMELELYPWNDPFTHRNEKQREIGTFYLHRTGTTLEHKYKGGTYKGLDITGNGGILIRSIKIGDIIYEGPCVTVNKLLEVSSYTMEELESNIQLIRHVWDDPIKPMYGARVGLTLKRAGNDIETWARHLILPRRSSIYVPTKGKDTWYVCNIKRDDVKTRSSIKYQAEYEEGKGMTLSSSMSLLQIAGYLSVK